LSRKSWNKNPAMLEIYLSVCKEKMQEKLWKAQSTLTEIERKQSNKDERPAGASPETLKRTA